MKAMTVKDFDSLQQRDLENGAVRDSIRIALKERELAQQKITVTMEEKYSGWGVKDGKKILIASLKKTKKETEKWLDQYSTHVSSLVGAYKIVKVKLVEVD